MGAPLVEKKKMAMVWFAMMPEERLRAGLPSDMLRLRRYLGVGSTAIKEWERQYFEGKTRQIMGKVYNPDEETTESVLSPDEVEFQSLSEEDLKKKIELFLYKGAEKGNANAGKILSQMKGWLIEKSEQTHRFEISADEHFRIRQEAERRVKKVQGRADRDRGVLPEPPLLLKEVRKD